MGQQRSLARGSFAWKCVQEINEGKNEEGKDLVDAKTKQKYRSLARSLNAMMQINGLAQTLGFLFAKTKQKDAEEHKEQQKKKSPTQKKEHYYLLEHLTNWMKSEDCRFHTNNKAILLNGGFDGLLQWVLHENTSSSDYRRATTECLAFGLWLRRFAEGTEEEGEHKNGTTETA